MVFEATEALVEAAAFLSAALNLWQWCSAARFPIHQRTPVSPMLPPVSLLKPLKGCDSETKSCLESWFTQDYPEFELLFGVADLDDPVCAIVQELQRKYPRVPCRLVGCDMSAGPNRKVAKLAALEPLARHRVLVVSDADVSAPPDFLKQVAPRLLDEKIGLVNCFYSLANPANLAMRWEALTVDADFWSHVLQAQTLGPLEFALGAAMAMRRDELCRIGGFAKLAGFLADDYQLGSLIAGAGCKIELSPIVVECRDAPMDFVQVWRHQTRWARTIRVCEPVPFFLSILSNATLWPLAWLAFNPSLGALLCVSAMAAVRVLTSCHLQTRMTRNRNHWPYAWLAPVKDILHLFLWALAFVGSDVSWRGQTFRVTRGGKLVNRAATAWQEASVS
jgi:ceramide glucosyltransferase